MTRGPERSSVMMTRPIPSTGEPMPIIGLGTWRAFDVGSDETGSRPLRQVLQQLFDGGGRIIDTSPMYGRAEAVTGDLLAESGARPRSFLATKVWTTGRDRGIEQMRRSAQLLRTEVIDLMQIHNLVDWRTHLATLRGMKEEGRVRYIGITHYTTGALPALARILRAEPGIDFVQLGYSLATRAAETELLPIATERGVAVIANQPLERGDLFRRVRRHALPDWAREFDCANWAELFLKYVLADPAVTCVIPATGNLDHMKNNLAAGFGALPDARQREQIRELWDAL
jgi:diketogulonate reductase-like aldo/keto reductase